MVPLGTLPEDVEAIARYLRLGTFTAVIRESWLGHNQARMLPSLGVLAIWPVLASLLARAVFRWEPDSMRGPNSAASADRSSAGLINPGDCRPTPPAARRALLSRVGRICSLRVRPRPTRVGAVRCVRCPTRSSPARKRSPGTTLAPNTQR
jgi:hypothetical protein